MSVRGLRTGGAAAAAAPLVALSGCGGGQPRPDPGPARPGVRVDGVSPPLDFRGGLGRCVIDSYTTKIHDNRYREIACYV